LIRRLPSIALALALFTTPLHAQVYQSGNITVGHIPIWLATGIIGDGGAVTANTTLAGGSTTSISAGTTDYCAASGCASSAAIAATVPFIGTAANLYATVAAAPGTGHTVTATLYTGTYGSLATTALTCTISGAATSCSDTTHQVNILAGQAWAIQLVVGSGATSTGGQSFGMQFISSTPPQPTAPYVLQSGNITSGHLVGWITNGVIGDGGAINIAPSSLNDVLCANINGLIFDCGMLGGTPLAQTAAFGTNTTQLATTAFVQAAITGAGVFPQTTAPISHEWFNSYTASTGLFTQTQPAFTDISGVATASQIPTPTASTLGGIESITSLAHNWIAYIDTSGVPHQSQPSFTDISGAASTAQIPAAPLASGSSTGNTLTAPYGYFICTAACTVTPPVPAAGYQFCVMNADNASGVITLGALGSSARYENTARTNYGTAGTGTLSSAGAVGDMICIIGLDSTHYLSPTYVGTWIAS
jgi:hypothetical protein